MLSVWTLDAPKHHEKTFGKHPTQKPLALLERIVAASTVEGSAVLDPFSGSATTGIAATRLNRRYVGIEMEDKFIALSIKRYNHEYTKQGRSCLLEREYALRHESRKQNNKALTLFEERR